MKLKLIGKVFSIFIVLCSITALIYSIYNIVDWYISGRENDKLTDEINNLIEFDVDDSEDDDGEEEITDENTSSSYNFEKLKEKNNETVGFVKVNGTKIEYTVVKHKDNFYYLTHSFDKSYNRYGWIYANHENKFDGTDKNITLFGHNMKNGSMFGTLKNVLTKEWQNNEDNLVILFITEGEANNYQVFSTYKIYKEEYFAKANFTDENDFADFIKTIKSRSNKNYNVDVYVNDQILTLSTCYKDNNYRVVLHAKKL